MARMTTCCSPTRSSGTRIGGRDDIAGSFAARTAPRRPRTSFTEVISTKPRRAKTVAGPATCGSAAGPLRVLLLCGCGRLAAGPGPDAGGSGNCKQQAERFRDADFRGPATRDHAVTNSVRSRPSFNDMRDRLRVPHTSRDYVDSILSGMNEAIIVTTDEGQIERINTATTHLLGYEEDELTEPRSIS